MEIWLVRHGETFGNKQRIVQGHSGGKLTKLGERQALLNQKKLMNVDFDAIYVSDSFRTRQTANIILEGSKYSKVHLSPLLREKGGGVMEGRLLSELRKQAVKFEGGYRNYKAEGGESWSDVHIRAETFFNNLCNRYFKGEEEKSNLYDIKQAVDIGDDYSSLGGEKCVKEEEGKEGEEEEKKEVKVKGKKSKINPETRKILTNLQEWESTHPSFKRILVVTHGGYIMEFYNTMKEVNGQKISNDNNAKNCALYIFGVTGGEAGGLGATGGKDEESKSSHPELSVDYLLINHKFHDEQKILTSTSTVMPSFTSKSSASTRPKPLPKPLGKPLVKPKASGPKPSTKKKVVKTKKEEGKKTVKAKVYEFGGM
ncbi:unnamed protein product [Moneuplotes crassus]|uniref:Phosphoglycerate mutase n=1 Tax=Euplotes crassus TaxID=5936 RepID=A0AAD1U6N7_EUPCR|nr:unnamed protein product [Moneuplotes crassus]